MNFKKTTKEHDRIIYLEPTIDRYFKVKFINTCDAMIHASNMGETFGLAVGEFSTCNKPIITYSNIDTKLTYEHLRILGDKGIYYNNENDLMNIFREFKKDSTKDWNCYRDYEPEKVMKIFEDIFLDIITINIDNKRLNVYKYHDLNKDGINENISKLCKIIINKDDIIIEIGSTFGYHTVEFSEYVGNNGKIYVYECNKHIYELLIRNLNNNNIKT